MNNLTNPFFKLFKFGQALGMQGAMISFSFNLTFIDYLNSYCTFWDEKNLTFLHFKDSKWKNCIPQSISPHFSLQINFSTNDFIRSQYGPPDFILFLINSSSVLPVQNPHTQKLETSI